jgi:hypothetical protein
MRSNALNVTLLLMVLLLVFAGTGIGGIDEWHEQTISHRYMEPSSSVPYDGGTTPSGVHFFTDPGSPPDGFNGGELYFYVNEARGWEQK